MVCTPQMPQVQREGYRRVLSSAIRLVERYPDRNPIEVLRQLRLQICGPEKVKRETPPPTP
jgi:hypothetical protein